MGCIIFNHLLLCLASFDFYCVSFAVNRNTVWVVLGAVQAIQHILWTQWFLAITVKLCNKERFDKEQIGIKELFMDYQPFYTINLLLDKELLPI